MANVNLHGWRDPDLFSGSARPTTVDHLGGDAMESRMERMVPYGDRQTNRIPTGSQQRRQPRILPKPNQENRVWQGTGSPIVTTIPS